jgi:S1-C subfamily serine protease
VHGPPPSASNKGAAAALPSLVPVLQGTSKDLQVGQRVFAIGNPFGLDRTLTQGIVSGVGRDIRSLTGRSIRDVIQTDASVNPGNSGGPLLDSRGRLIGVNTVILSPSGAWAGVGFAVPIDTVRRVVDAIITSGHVPKPALGVHAAADAQARMLNLPRGVLIIEATPGGSADRAGLRGTRRDRVGALVLGDVITALADKPVASVEDLLSAVEEHAVGESVDISVLRDGREQHYRVKLGERAKSNDQEQ